MFSRTWTTKSTGTFWEQIEQLRRQLAQADAVIIGAGAGLSASAGFQYNGERFNRYFSDFEEKYGFHDMYSGGFYPYDTLEEQWAYWSRYIFINRYMDPPKPVYNQLYELVKDKDYFVLTTNVDHCFQKAGFDKGRLFYTQGDYGLFQCGEPCHLATYENKDAVFQMVRAQGFAVDENGALYLPEGVIPKMSVPSQLVPRCPKCGKPMGMNLRSDDTFVEDELWHRASQRYASFLSSCQNGKVLFLELAVGFNTPGIIKYPFWRMTAKNPNAVYACINAGQAYAPKEIQKRSICINEDVYKTLDKI